MRFDRLPRHPAVIVETPVGVIYELDVWLTAAEIAGITGGICGPSSSRIYEPWLRITCGVEDTLRAGVDVVDQDEG